MLAGELQGSVLPRLIGGEKLQGGACACRESCACPDSSRVSPSVKVTHLEVKVGLREVLMQGRGEILCRSHDHATHTHAEHTRRTHTDSTQERRMLAKINVEAFEWCWHDLNRFCVHRSVILSYCHIAFFVGTERVRGWEATETRVERNRAQQNRTSQNVIEHNRIEWTRLQ